jgi:hypothetical protein
MPRLPCLLLSLLCVGCTVKNVVQLRPEAQKVQLSTSKPEGCQALGEVFGKSDSSDGEEALAGARSDIRNRAAALGATHVHLETSNSKNSTGFGKYEGHVELLLSGQALQCP